MKITKFAVLAVVALQPLAASSAARHVAPARHAIRCTGTATEMETGKQTTTSTEDRVYVLDDNNRKVYRFDDTSKSLVDLCRSSPACEVNYGGARIYVDAVTDGLIANSITIDRVSGEVRQFYWLERVRDNYSVTHEFRGLCRAVPLPSLRSQESKF